MGLHLYQKTSSYVAAGKGRQHQPLENLLQELVLVYMQPPGLSVNQEDWLDEYSKPNIRRTAGNQASFAVNHWKEYEGSKVSLTLQITLHVNYIKYSLQILAITYITYLQFC